jgi:DNA-binding MarR family transcriptional regulator
MVNTPELVASIIDNIRRVFQVVYEHSKVIERETGLTGSQMWAIKVIAEAGSIKPSELAKRMYLHPATVVGLIDRLVKKGLVSRTRSETDRRIVEITLTDNGRSLLGFAPDVTQRRLVKGLEDLPEQGILKVAEGLEELVRILGAEGLPPQLILSPDVNVPSRGKISRIASVDKTFDVQVIN